MSVEYSDRLQRVEVAVAVLEVETHEIKHNLDGIRDDIRTTRNYTLTTLLGGLTFVVWQVIIHGLRP